MNEQLNHKTKYFFSAFQKAGASTWEYYVNRGAFIWSNVEGVREEINIDIFLSKIFSSDRIELEKHFSYCDINLPEFDIIVRCCSHETDWIYYRLIGKCFKEDDSHYYAGVMIDCTVEENVKKDIIKQQEEKRIILDNIKESVVFLSPDFKVIWSNRFAADTVLDKYKTTSESAPCYQIYYNLNEPCENCPARKCLITGNAESSEMFNNRGETLLIRAVPVFSGKNELLGIVETVLDISEIKKKESELILARKKAEESDRLKSAFLVNMSHEIRTPVTSIIGFTRFLIDEDFTEEQKKDFVVIIDRNIDQLLHLISDIIDLSRIEANQLDLYPDNFNINDVLTNLAQEFNPHIHQVKRPINFRLSLVPSQIILYADELRFRQVVNNLLHNALKFTNEGLIELSTEIEEDFVKVVIRDTGRGIPESAQSKIFTRFYQIDDPLSKDVKGTGLGLSIARELVRLMGGTIEFYSIEHAGSTFSFSLPIFKKS
jgi:signal transduction histidine kinase